MYLRILQFVVRFDCMKCEKSKDLMRILQYSTLIGPTSCERCLTVLLKTLLNMCQRFCEET